MKDHIKLKQRSEERTTLKSVIYIYSHLLQNIFLKIKTERLEIKIRNLNENWFKYSMLR